MKKALMLGVLIALFVLGIILLTQSRFRLANRGFLTVTDVWKNPRQYDQQIIRLRGAVITSIFMTQLTCCPKACNCYRVTVALDLASDPPTHVNPLAPEDYIGISDLNCIGNECDLTCSPFQPGFAGTYEFVGRVEVTYRYDDSPISIALIEIDYSSSRQLVGGEWESVQTGTFISTLSPELASTLSGQSFSLCEEK